MTNLNDKIIQKVFVGPTLEPRYVKYYVTYFDIAAAFYVGRLFITSMQTEADIYLNDILRSQVKIENILNENGISHKAVELIKTIKVIVVDGETETTYNYGPVLMRYVDKYGAYKYDHILENWQLYDEFPEHASLCLTGCTYNKKDRSNNKYALVPRYPQIETHKLNFVQAVNFGEDLYRNDLELATVTDDDRKVMIEKISLDVDNMTYAFSIPLDMVFIFANTMTKVVFSSNAITAENNEIVAANVDACPAKYYLQWIDRLGGVQCLPFDGKEIKTIDYNVLNITNKFNEKRPISFDNTYNFDINTKHLSDKEMPVYESIFVSPYIKLYDTENDVAYDVIVMDKSFVLKTFKNNGNKLYNLNIKLAINNNENILY